MEKLAKSIVYILFTEINNNLLDHTDCCLQVQQGVHKQQNKQDHSLPPNSNRQHEKSTKIAMVISELHHSLTVLST